LSVPNPNPMTRMIDASHDLTPRRLSLPAELHWLAPLEVDGLIRVGGDEDGGYVVPRPMIDDTDALISMGIGFSWEFERHFRALRPAVRIQAYDHTVSDRSFRKHLLLGVAGLLTGRVGLSEVSDRRRILRDYRRFFSREATHFRSRIHNRLDGPVDVDIATVFARAGAGRKFVKMDIEGSEYRVLDDVLTHADELVGMIVEFHDTDPLRPVFVRAMEHILREFEIVHLHANNWSPAAVDGLPEVLEVTFAKREYCGGTKRRTVLPLEGLDRPNRADAPDYRLEFAAPG
jgi:hypothetical protein